MSDLSVVFKTSQAKAIFGAISGGLTGLLASLAGILTDGKTLADLSTGQWVTVVTATLVGAGITHQAVYQTTNQVRVEKPAVVAVAPTAPATLPSAASSSLAPLPPMDDLSVLGRPVEQQTLVTAEAVPVADGAGTVAPVYDSIDGH